MNYKNKLLLFSCVLLTAFSNAQVGSPYSQFGFGDNQSRGFERSKAMGGIGIALQSKKNLNNINPASYIALDSLSTIYALGVNTGFNKIESSIDELQRNDTKFGYFTLGFKGNKYWAASFGLMPATTVDYTYMVSENNDVNGAYDYIYHGNGGLNKFYWGNSFQVTPNLSLGINASYIFGAINKVTTVFFAENYFNKDYSTDLTKVKRKQNVYDFTFDYGIQYKFDLKEKSNLIVGAVYQNKMNLRSKRSVIGGSVVSSGIDEDFFKDFYDVEIASNVNTIVIDTSNIKSYVALPHSFGFGVSYSNDKLVAGVDIIQELWSGIESDLHNAKYENLLSLRGGLELTPDVNSVNYYYKRVNYRFGGHYTQSHLNINGTRINDYGISFGVGLPLRNSKTTFNIAAEFGQRGTLEQNLLKETYGIVSLNISLSDIWFVKRKFK